MSTGNQSEHIDAKRNGTPKLLLIGEEIDRVLC